jgi:hypothetical protein
MRWAVYQMADSSIEYQWAPVRLLTDAGGGLRATDVGKHVAVPGAMDLVASITELVNQKDVEHASMTAGSPMLTAPLGPGNGFRADLNAGQRITVTDAGPGGATLLSDVVEVINATTIRLADSASTTVSDALAILNRPDEVGLDDHARASATNVTVNLGDRSVSYAQMVTEASRSVWSCADQLPGIQVPSLHAARLAPVSHGSDSGRLGSWSPADQYRGCSRLCHDRETRIWQFGCAVPLMTTSLPPKPRPLRPWQHEI